VRRRGRCDRVRSCWAHRPHTRCREPWLRGAGGGSLAQFQALASAPDLHFAVVFNNLHTEKLAVFLRAATSAGGEYRGAGLPTNGISVVRAGESLIVDCNAAGLALLLREAAEAVRADDGRVELRPVTFASERARAVNAQVGSYERIDVFCIGGDAATAPSARLARTSWAATDVLVRRMPPPPRGRNTVRMALRELTVYQQYRPLTGSVRQG
jgi:hypothetical protein